MPILLIYLMTIASVVSDKSKMFHCIILNSVAYKMNQRIFNSTLQLLTMQERVCIILVFNKMKKKLRKIEAEK